MDRNINNHKKAWYKRVWVWIGIIVVLAIIGTASNGSEKTPTATTNTTTATSVSDKKQEPKPAKWDVEAAYAKVNNGMTKAQVEEATAKKSDNCTESDMGEYGKSEVCTYGNAFTDKAQIIVTYSNGEASTKTKSTY